MSRGRFVLLLVALAVAVGFAVYVLMQAANPTTDDAPALAPSTQQEQTPTASAAPLTEEAEAPPEDDLAALPDAPDATDTATEFTRVWLAGGSAASNEAWVTELHPLVTDAVAEMLEATPLEALPSASLAGLAEERGARTETSRRYNAVLTDDSMLLIRTAWDGERWRVAQYGSGDSI